MEVKILKDEKNVLEIELDNLTVAEVLRAYLNFQKVDFAAWRQEHPTKNPILHIEGENPKKALKSAISQIEKEIDSLVSSVKKAK